jgi:PAS domain S-box-containing protein
VATFEGAVRSSFSTEYVILLYLLIVATIPFRPAQVGAIGGTVALVVYLLGPSGLAWTGEAALSAGMAKHLLFITGGSVLITGASVALYRRHHSFGTTQASLQKSRDLLRRTQEVAQVGGWEYDPESNTVRGTVELYDILDLPDETRFALDVFCTGRVAPILRVRLAPPGPCRQQCLQEGEAFDCEASLTTAQDNRREVRIRGTAETKTGEGTQITGILQDITEREAMAHRIREQERLLRSITENVSDGIFRMVPGDGLIYANQAFARLFGYDEVAEILALDAEDLYAHPEEQTDLLSVSEDGARSDREVVFRREDGSTFIGLLGGSVTRDDEDVKYVDGVVTDITDLKEREKALKGERDRFETLFESLLQEDR